MPRGTVQSAAEAGVLCANIQRSGRDARQRSHSQARALSGAPELCSAIGKQVRVCAPGCVGDVCARVQARGGEKKEREKSIQCSVEQL